MTFDFAPDDKDPAAHNVTRFAPPPRLKVASKPAFAVAHRPTSAELAALVGELFREGALNWDQIRSLAETSDLGQALLEEMKLSSATTKIIAAE